jgi:hypothetical protein
VDARGTASRGLERGGSAVAWRSLIDYPRLDNAVSLEFSLVEVVQLLHTLQSFSGTCQAASNFVPLYCTIHSTEDSDIGL